MIKSSSIDRRDTIEALIDTFMEALMTTDIAPLIIAKHGTQLKSKVAHSICFRGLT